MQTRTRPMVHERTLYMARKDSSTTEEPNTPTADTPTADTPTPDTPTPDVLHSKTFYIKLWKKKI